MTLKALLLGVLGIVLSFGTGAAVAAEQSSDQKRFDQQIQQGGGDMGVPTPGSVADQESTKKKRNPDRSHTADQNAQITMGGAQYFVYGDVLRIEGNNYWIKDEESGNEVKLIVNSDTNMDCGAKASSGGSMASDREQQAAGSTDRQRAQGQRKNETATGSGFGAGQCAFQQGDKVKAEVSDLGTVTTLKLMPPQQHSKSTGSFQQMAPSSGSSSARDKSPDVQNVPGMKENMESAVAPPDLRPEGQMGETQKGQPQQQASIPGCPPSADKGEVWRGKVISFDKDTLVAKNKSGEKRMHIDRCTQKGQIDTRGEMFKQGDRIEAYVAPDGHVISIGIMKAHPNYGKDDPEASG